MPFDLCRIAGADSKSELARRLRKVWLTLAPRDRVPEANAIASRLGDLERDRAGWWEVRPEAQRAFEEVTRIGFRELPLARDVIASPDFARLRPFRPREEHPLPLGTADWFTPPRPGERRWIVAPPGAGRSFAVQWHRVWGSARATEAARLSDAADHFEVDAPIAIAVDVADPDGDPSALMRLDARDKLLVIAPFAPAVGAPSGDERSTLRGPRPGWSVEEWQLAPGARERFVRWIAGRIDDRESLLDADQLLSWLERVDARRETFATPADIVALCAFSNDHGVPSSRKHLGDRFLEVRLGHEAQQGREGGAWLRTWGIACVKALVDARLQRIDLPLWGPLDRATWAGLLPSGIAPRALEAPEVDALLDRKRTPKKVARDRLLRRSGPEAIELLSSARVLRGHGTGHSLHPRWAMLELARARVREAVADGSPAAWGRWAVDEERRELVDAALDDLPLDRLVRLSGRVVRDFDRTSLGAVGAIEAVFAAFGRRLGPGTRGPEELLALWEIQRSLLAEQFTNTALRLPLTRPIYESKGEWLACCWSWSLYGPRARVDDAEGWLFPGWCEPSLQQMAMLRQVSTGEPGWSGRESPEEAERLRRPRGAFLRLLEMAFEIVQRCQKNPALPEELSPVLLPAVLLTTHPRTPPWSPSPKHVLRLTGSRWGGDFLVERANARPPAERAAIARTIWSALLRKEQGAIHALDELRQSPVLDFLVQHLTAEDFAGGLSRPDLHQIQQLRKLPVPFRLPFIRHVIRHDAERIPSNVASDALDPRSDLGPEDAPWIEALVDANPHWIHRQALWRVAPAQALERALAADVSDGEHADWLVVAPRWAHARLLDHLASAPRPLPSRAILWLRHRLLDGGADADRAYALLEPP